jgi:hypothetical protein
LAETQVFRFKVIFGYRLQTRQIDNQFKELTLKNAISNRMTHLGIPDSVGRRITDRSKQGLNICATKPSLITNDQVY